MSKARLTVTTKSGMALMTIQSSLSQFFSFPWRSARLPSGDVYEPVEVVIREMNLWAEPLGYVVIRGRTKDKSLQKFGSFAIGAEVSV
jgi:hypothetical protein